MTHDIASARNRGSMRRKCATKPGFGFAFFRLLRINASASSNFKSETS